MRATSNGDVRWTDLEEGYIFAHGLNKKGARGKAEMSIFAFFKAKWRQRKPPLRGGDRSPQGGGEPGADSGVGQNKIAFFAPLHKQPAGAPHE